MVENFQPQDPARQSDLPERGLAVPQELQVPTRTGSTAIESARKVLDRTPSDKEQANRKLNLNPDEWQSLQIMESALLSGQLKELAQEVKELNARPDRGLNVLEAFRCDLFRAGIDNFLSGNKEHGYALNLFGSSENGERGNQSEKPDNKGINSETEPGIPGNSEADTGKPGQPSKNDAKNDIGNKKPFVSIDSDGSVRGSEAERQAELGFEIISRRAIVNLNAAASPQTSNNADINRQPSNREQPPTPDHEAAARNNTPAKVGELKISGDRVPDAQTTGNNAMGKTSYQEFLGIVNEARQNGRFNRDSDLGLGYNFATAEGRNQILKEEHVARLDAIKCFNERIDVSDDGKKQSYFQIARLLSNKTGADGSRLADKILMTVSKPDEIKQGKMTCTATGDISLLLSNDPQLYCKLVADAFLSEAVMDSSGKILAKIDPDSINVKNNSREREARFGKNPLSGLFDNNNNNSLRPWDQRLAELAIANAHWGTVDKDAQGRDIQPGLLSYRVKNSVDQLMRKKGDNDWEPETDIAGNTVNYPGIPFGGMSTVYKRITGKSDDEVKSLFVIHASAPELDRRGLVTVVSNTAEIEKALSGNKTKLLYVSLNKETSMFGKEFAALPQDQQQVKGNLSARRGSSDKFTQATPLAHVLTAKGFNALSKVKIDNYFPPDHIDDGVALDVLYQSMEFGTQAQSRHPQK